MEPVSPLEDLVPVYHARRDGGDGRAGTVVDDLAGPCHGAGLEEVDPEAVAAGDAVRGAHPEGAELAKAAARYVVVWKAGDELGVDTVIGK